MYVIEFSQNTCNVIRIVLYFCDSISITILLPLYYFTLLQYWWLDNGITSNYWLTLSLPYIRSGSSRSSTKHSLREPTSLLESSPVFGSGFKVPHTAASKDSPSFYSSLKKGDKKSLSPTTPLRVSFSDEQFDKSYRCFHLSVSTWLCFICLF